MSRVIALDTETTGLTWKDKAFCVSLAYGIQSNQSEVWKNRKIIEKRLHLFDTFVFHSAKFDLTMMINGGFLEEYPQHRTIEDIHLMAHLLDPNRDNSLKALARDYLLLEDMVEVEIKSGPNKGKIRKVPKEEYEVREARRKLKLKKSDGYDKLPWDVIKPYAIQDAVFTYRLYHILRPLIIENGMEDVYLKEIDLIPALMYMESNGLKIDQDKLRSNIEECTQELYEVESTLIEAAAGWGIENFNPGSPLQVKQLFANQGYILEDTSKETLRSKELIDLDQTALILRYRELSKILSTYLEGIESEMVDGVLHPNFKSNVRTGRMASGGYDE